MNALFLLCCVLCAGASLYGRARAFLLFSWLLHFQCADVADIYPLAVWNFSSHGDWIWRWKERVSGPWELRIVVTLSRPLRTSWASMGTVKNTTPVSWTIPVFPYHHGSCLPPTKQQTVWKGDIKATLLWYIAMSISINYIGYSLDIVTPLLWNVQGLSSHYHPRYMCTIIITRIY